MDISHRNDADGDTAGSYSTTAGNVPAPLSCLTVNASLLGMEEVVSEDSVRRNLATLNEADRVA